MDTLSDRYHTVSEIAKALHHHLDLISHRGTMDIENSIGSNDLIDRTFEP